MSQEVAGGLTHRCLLTHLVVSICYDLCRVAVELEEQVAAGTRLLRHSSLHRTEQPPWQTQDAGLSWADGDELTDGQERMFACIWVSLHCSWMDGIIGLQDAVGIYSH